jgi:hypothetical protein
MTEIFCFVDDYLLAHPQLANWRQSHNAKPRFTDSEVITIALMQSFLGVPTLKQAFQLIRHNYRDAFPQICTYKQWLARLHRLSELIGHLVEAAGFSDGFRPCLYLIDSKPIPVCKPIRHWSVRLLREDGAYFGKTAKGWFFGFKLHTFFHIDGQIVGAILTPGNYADREAALDLGLLVDGGIVLGDRAYGGEPSRELLAREADLLMLTRKQAPEKKALLSSIRQRVETYLGKLCHYFVDTVYSRSWLGLWNTIKLKLLAYNLRHAGLVSI